MAAALRPVVAEIAGLPGAPVGAKEVASTSGGQDVQSGISGNPPAFEFTAEHVGMLFGQFLGIPDPVGWREGFQQGVLDAFLTERPSHEGLPQALLGPAQQAVEDALLTAAGTNVSATIGQMLENGQTVAGSPAVRSAAQRFAALSAGARHAWLAGHLAALPGRHDHVGADPVTAAEVLKPSAAPAGAAGRGPAAARLGWLHLRSRRVPAALLVLAVCGALLHAALYWHWAFNSGAYAQQVPMIIEAGAATVIAVTAHSPFGETERSAGHWLPYLRLLTVAGMCGLAIALLQLGAAGESLNQGIVVLARNVVGFTGIGLLCSLVTGALLAWTLPMGYMLFCQYALLQSWTAPWTWPVRPPADRGAWLWASAVFAVSLLLFTIRGPRARLTDDS